jgi:hypothetical protein
MSASSLRPLGSESFATIDWVIRTGLKSLDPGAA